MNTKELINEYIESKANAWAESTKTSERHRLNSVSHLVDGSPDNLWAGIQSMGGYSRLTLWTRVVDFRDWLMTRKLVSDNPFRSWRKENMKVFKNVYEKKKPSISFAEAKARIETIQNSDVRSKALQLLTGGLRYSESLTQRDGSVVGKGGKSRRVYSATPMEYRSNYQQLRRTLSPLGLKPHDLRKIFLSRLVEKGANEFELCEVAGWSSIATASSYIKVNSARLSRLVEDAIA